MNEASVASEFDYRKVSKESKNKLHNMGSWDDIIEPCMTVMKPPSQDKVEQYVRPKGHDEVNLSVSEFSSDSETFYNPLTNISELLSQSEESKDNREQGNY